MTRRETQKNIRAKIGRLEEELEAAGKKREAFRDCSRETEEFLRNAQDEHDEAMEKHRNAARVVYDIKNKEEEGWGDDYSAEEKAEAKDRLERCRDRYEKAVYQLERAGLCFDDDRAELRAVMESIKEKKELLCSLCEESGRGTEAGET